MFYFLYNSQRFLPFLNLSPLSRQLLPPWARSYSSSTSCQEVGIVAYVSSSMSVHEGERGGWEQAVGERKKKTPRERRELLLNSVFVCRLLTQQNELTNWWGRGKKIPISTTNRLRLFLDVLLSSQHQMMNCARNHFQLTFSQQDGFWRKHLFLSSSSLNYSRICKT